MTHKQLATDLLTPIWRGISPDYKRRYVFNIWQQLEDNVRSAAYTSSLSVFLAKTMLRLGVMIFADDTEKVAKLVAGGNDKAILKMLREETALLVLLVRVANEERKVKKRIERKEHDENISL